jgi:predicted transposase YbfD/YdcC
MKSPIEYFSAITDPRMDRTREHSLSDIIFISIAAVICGAETWNDIEAFGKAKKAWLKRYLKLKNGIPSHDTFNRVFSMLDPNEFERCFLAWIKDVAQISEGEVISIDGKSIRGSAQRGSKAMVHMVSAWASTNHLLLGQVKVADKSNEITAIPRLLEVLAIKGCIVTIDAMGCQTEIARKIKEQGGEYILAVKSNQPGLEQAIKDTCLLSKPLDSYEQTDSGHGRIETRMCKIYDDLSHLENKSRWKGLQRFAVLTSTRYIKATGLQETEQRFYITSLATDAKTLESGIRKHWGIENSLHWVLDVAFNEDGGTKQNENAVQNFSLLNRIALNILKNEKSKKRSVKGKRLDAGWDHAYLLRVLQSA